ncbi:MAG: sulfatase [Geminicoccaceae bacterium]
MVREDSGRGWFIRRLPVLLVAVAALAGVAGVLAWQYRAELRLLPHYIRPIDGRERIAAQKDSFDVLFMVLDACRADKLSAYGFERETAPGIEALARDPDATLFRRHYANATWTKPSTASLFTGMFVHEHGMFKPWRPTQDDNTGRSFATQMLSDEIETMAEMFAEEGYYTFAATGGHHIDRQFGFAQGFDEYVVPGLQRARMWVTDAFIRSIEGNYFGYMHLTGCHQPFPPRVRHEGYMATYGVDYAEAERIAQGVDFTTTEIMGPLNEGSLKLTDDDLRFLNLIYEAQMRWMDEEFVQPLLATLKETGRYDNTLIIVTADHGEALYEHQGYAHAGDLVWEEVVHIPLIVKFPKSMRPPALSNEVEELTSSVDLLPALAALLGRAAPEQARGAPIFGGTFVSSILIEGHACPPALDDCLVSWAVLKDRYKLIERRGEALLFDLERDPLERNSIAEDRPELVVELRAAAAELRSGSTTDFLARDVETEIDDDAVRALRGLGYIQ